MAKAGKVIHVSDSVHAQIKRYCDERDLNAKQWIEEVVAVALLADKQTTDPEIERLRTRIRSLQAQLAATKGQKPVVPVPVETKKMTAAPPADPDFDVFNRPAFWEPPKPKEPEVPAPSVVPEPACDPFHNDQ